MIDGLLIAFNVVRCKIRGHRWGTGCLRLDQCSNYFCQDCGHFPGPLIKHELAPVKRYYEKSYDVPRRAQMWNWTPAEHAIYQATQEVEKMGASLKLTKAVTLLSQARDAVADHVDGVE